MPRLKQGETTRFNAHIEPAQSERLQRMAYEQRLSMSQVLRAILSEYFQQLDRKSAA